MLQFTTGAIAGLLAATLALRYVPTSNPASGSSRPSVAPPEVAAAEGADRSAGAGAASALAPWWECVQGATLEVNAPRVRCFTTGTVTEVVPACGVGHALVINLSGNQDRCRNVAGGLLSYTCPPQFLPVISSGQDICRRTALDVYQPPSREVS